MRLELILCLFVTLPFLQGCNTITGNKRNEGDQFLQSKTIDKYDNYTDWAIYRGDKKANQYSELAQINATNVNKLEPAWEYHTGDFIGPSMYSNPIVVEGLMYFTTPKLNVVALDAITGEEVWVFDPSKYSDDNEVFRGRSRGVTYWEDANGQNQRIFNFVRDRVYALDAKTGERIEPFGEDGFIDLRQNLPIDPEMAAIEVTSPGIVYQNFLIVGSRVPEGERLSTPGDIRAYDTKTGEFKWIFHTIPQEGEFGYETWEFNDDVSIGGANPWGGFSLDEERGWVFFATGSPSPDFIYGGDRKGKGLFGNCIVALDATTGERQWHYQTIHHDIFDYDNPPAPILTTIKSKGQSRDAVVQLTKMGLTFVLDRDTGEPIFPVVEIPVPASGVPGEEAWPTQPFPIKPPPLARLSLDEADLNNITPESHASVLEEFKKYKTGFLYTPATEQGTITLPGHQGGVEWGGGSFDPYSNVLYVNVNEAPTINKLVKYYDYGDDGDATPVQRGAQIYNQTCTACHGASRQGNPPAFPALTDIKLNVEELREVIHNGRGMMPAFPQFSKKQVNDLIAFLQNDFSESDENLEEQIIPMDPRIRYSNEAPFFVDPDGYPAISPPWGTLQAIDIAEGTILWKVPLGEYPELVAKGIRNTGSKSFGGPVSTAGDVVFQAGTPDEKIRAFSTHSGEVLWEYQLPAGGYATPSVYMIEGKQYVVIAAGGGGKNGTKYGDSIIAFALPDYLNDGPPEEEKTSSKWIDLFDGSTLKGWVHLNGSHTYYVEDSAIIGRTVEGSPNSFLGTTKTFDDFELELEAMVDSVTNSGIQIRTKVKQLTLGDGPDSRAGRVYGPQVELVRNQGSGKPTTGLIYGEALGTGWLSADDEMQNGHNHLINDGWNKIRIVAKGPRIQTWVNGEQVEDLVNENVYKSNPRGFIGLQMHGIEGRGPYVMKWRNIRIRPLDNNN
ncbi:family 16 glycoside hydrolase [Salegentibacter sp. F188]|uniref:Family 16 glycoside hydrolase n=1 Tax=Autumnicola patrickiae TaxID=3075591 RepID=A0ABU3DZD5_9FLAO|nr:family 16 glycoside hydrolase [Salegentibacter sp. F188]MDT0689077.1 family 16 glycoside hydrolase [Salegentibacter sp. F188]